MTTIATDRDAARDADSTTVGEPARAWVQPGAGRGRTVALISIYDAESNALRQLAAGLRQRGVRTLEIYFKDWRNNRFDEPTAGELQSLYDLLRREGAALVGISLRGSAYEDFTARLCGLLHRELDLPIVLGGWHPTVRPEACMAFADAICRGEADRCLPQFVDAFFAGDKKRLLHTPGFWVRDSTGQIHRAPMAPLIEDLDSLPWRDFTHPDKWFIQGRTVFHGDPRSDDPRLVVTASYGCPNRCSFCHHSARLPVTGSRVRTRSVSDVIAEVRAFRDQNPKTRRVRFDDAIFGQQLPWLEELADRWPTEVGLPIELMTEPNWVTPSYVRLLARAGADIVELGIQSSDAINKSHFSRKSSQVSIRRAVQLLDDHGMYLRYLVIVDIPDLSSDEHQALLEQLLSFPRPYDLFLFSLCYFPGSAWVEDRLASGELPPADVDDRAKKIFRQYRVDLAHPRPPEQAWWLALMVLDASQLLPRRLLRAIVRHRLHAQNPEPLLRIARLAGVVKTGRVGARLARRGELPTYLLRRWLNPRSWITQ